MEGITKVIFKIRQNDNFTLSTINNNQNTTANLLQYCVEKYKIWNWSYFEKLKSFSINFFLNSPPKLYLGWGKNFHTNGKSPIFRPSDVPLVLLACTLSYVGERGKTEEERQKRKEER